MAEENVNKYMSFLYILNNLCKLLETPKEVEDKLVSIDNDVYSMFTDKPTKAVQATKEKITEKSIDLALKASSIFEKYSNIDFLAQKYKPVKIPEEKKNPIPPKIIASVALEDKTKEKEERKSMPIPDQSIAAIPDSLKSKQKPKSCIHAWEIAKYSFMNDRAILINKCTLCSNEAKHSTPIKELTDQYSFIKLICSSSCSICNSTDNTDDKIKLQCSCVAHFHCLIGQLRNRFNLHGINSLRTYFCQTHPTFSQKDMTLVLGNDQDCIFAAHYYNTNPKHKRILLNSKKGNLCAMWQCFSYCFNNRKL